MFTAAKDKMVAYNKLIFSNETIFAYEIQGNRRNGMEKQTVKEEEEENTISVCKVSTVQHKLDALWFSEWMKEK